MSLTDTKTERLAIIVIVVVIVFAAITMFTRRGRTLADQKADRVEVAARELAAIEYGDIIEAGDEAFTLEGVEPGLVDDSFGRFVVGWDVHRWGVHHCIEVRWEPPRQAVVTRTDC